MRFCICVGVRLLWVRAVMVRWSNGILMRQICRERLRGIRDSWMRTGRCEWIQSQVWQGCCSRNCRSQFFVWWRGWRVWFGREHKAVWFLSWCRVKRLGWLSWARVRCFLYRDGWTAELRWVWVAANSFFWTMTCNCWIENRWGRKVCVVVWVRWVW